MRMDHFCSPVRATMLGLVALVAMGTAGCDLSGGGNLQDKLDRANLGGKDVSSALIAVETFHADGSIESRGMIDRSDRRQETWRHWAADGSLLFEGTYRDGALVTPWVEYNANGSVRYHHTDGPHPSGGALPALPE